MAQPSIDRQDPLKAAAALLAFVAFVFFGLWTEVPSVGWLFSVSYFATLFAAMFWTLSVRYGSPEGESP